ncbi:non-structural maintenance of chromosomes element 1 homolog isoform X2 [Anabrus simplex]|uniref:non-structural maintenance of chromosomes element 1 homolog isoform X2 n=1 Tax=Anabrus simplex TaxID=316456 RepID=UPI0034DCF2C6
MSQMGYTDVHRLLLQNFMCEPVMLKQNVTEKVRKLCRQVQGNTEADLKTLIDDINLKIKNHGLEIRQGTCEVTLKSYFVLVHTKQDTISKTMKYYSTTEQTFLKKILDEIFSSNEGYTTSIVCINFNHQVSKSFSKTEANSTLRKLVDDKWLALKDGKIFIGIRARIELEPFFKVEYGDYMTSCDLCKQITLIGYSCKSCDKIYHEFCIQKYFHTYRVDPFCPSCKTEWKDVQISEDFDSDCNGNSSEHVSELSQPSTSTGRSTQSTTSRRSNLADFDFLGASSSSSSIEASTVKTSRRH